MNGVIKKYDKRREFGFILSDEESGDIFFHKNDILDKDVVVEEGTLVAFDVKHSKKGTSARNIQIVIEEGKPEYITLGNLKLKPAAIKEFGIRDAAAKWLQKAKDLEVSIWHDNQNIAQNNQFQEIYYDNRSQHNDMLRALLQTPEYKAAEAGKLDELYVITLSGAEYSFCELDFDIHAMLEELNKIL